MGCAIRIVIQPKIIFSLQKCNRFLSKLMIPKLHPFRTNEFFWANVVEIGISYLITLAPKMTGVQNWCIFILYQLSRKFENLKNFWKVNTWGRQGGTVSNFFFSFANLFPRKIPIYRKNTKTSLYCHFIQWLVREKAKLKASKWANQEWVFL